MPTLLEKALALQARIKHTVKINPGLPKHIIAQRFGLSMDRLREYLSERPVRPSSYKRTAACIRRELEEVTANREAGKRWCRFCSAWFPEAEFNPDSESFKHQAASCRSGRKK